jgi:hypothetical protein
VAQEFNILAMVKGNEHYVYIYDDANRPDLLEVLQAQAADGQLSLNFFDAAVLSRKAHEQAAAADEERKCFARF